MKQYHVYGLGNALVDIEYKVDAKALRDLGIDSTRFDTVVDNIINEAASLGSPDVIRKVCEEML